MAISINTYDCECNPKDIKFGIKICSSRHHYTPESYEITPDAYHDIVLPTRGKVLDGDIVLKAVPHETFKNGEGYAISIAYSDSPEPIEAPINKVEFGGNTLIDLSDVTVDEEHLAIEKTAHDRTGTKITGIAESKLVEDEELLVVPEWMMGTGE